MGARPIALANCLRFGEWASPHTQHLYRHVVKGSVTMAIALAYQLFGNVAFDPAYQNNILVNAMAVGLVDESKIFIRSTGKPSNLLVYAGSYTGLDGIGPPWPLKAFLTRRNISVALCKWVILLWKSFLWKRS